MNEFDWERFNVGFWHPFGPYTGLCEPQILRWKQGETKRFGWTFWSFVYSQNAHAWLTAHADVSGPVFALCSQSRGIDPDPHGGKLHATCFQWPGEVKWNKMPSRDRMKVTNPFKRQGRALAFRVRRIIELTPTVPPFEAEWYSKGKQVWQSTRLPPRGEFLIRRGPGMPLRKVRAVLELMPPYFATLRHVPEDNTAA